jgi:hypothetical protein
MEFNWSILGWIAGLVFVYLFGLFEGRGQGYKKRKAEEEQEKKEQPAARQTAQSSAPAKSETITVDDPGLLRIKNEKGSFVLDLDGNRVNPISLSSDQRKRLVDMLNIMRPWLEGRSAPAASPRPAPPPASSRPVTVDDRLNALGSPAPQSQPVPPQPEPPAPRSSTIAKEDRPVAPANSIVSQIDTILQERLAGTNLEERGVFLAQSAEGGVIVFVGLTRYNGIDDVPDPDVKAAIRAAIAEWERKYTPGF